MENKAKSIILMGIKHCGKSTQGKILAEKLNTAFFDTDDLITDIEKESPREIYTKLGKKGFMDAEFRACLWLKENEQDSQFVVATGGGICDNTKALEVLRPLGTFVFLQSDESLSCERIIKKIITKKDGTLENVPAYIAKENPHTLEDVRVAFHKFYTERCKIYSEITDISVQMTSESIEQNAKRLLLAISAAAV